MRYWFLAVILYMALEMVVLVFTVQQMGWLTTITLFVLIAVIGVYIARREGMEALRKVAEHAHYGEAPGPAILDGVCVFIGSIFLIIPGIVSNVIALALLLPFTRKLFKPFLMKILSKMASRRSVIYYRS